jgi:hypothetical protein
VSRPPPPALLLLLLAVRSRSAPGTAATVKRLTMGHTQRLYRRPLHRVRCPLVSSAAIRFVGVAVPAVVRVRSLGVRPPRRHSRWTAYQGR